MMTLKFVILLVHLILNAQSMESSIFIYYFVSESRLTFRKNFPMIIMENFRIIFIAKNLFFIFIFLVWVYFIWPSRDAEDRAKVAEKIELMRKKLGLTNQTVDKFKFESDEISSIKACYLKKLNSLIEMPNINSTLDWMEIGHLPQVR